MIFFQFFIKYSIHHPLSADTSFKFLALILFEIRHLQNFIPLSKGRNLTRGDNSGKTKNMRRLFFHEESIHEVSRQYLQPPYTHTSQNQYVPHFFKVGGITRPKHSLHTKSCKVAATKSSKVAVTMSRKVAATRSCKVAATKSSKTILHTKNSQAATMPQLAAATKPQHCCLFAAIHCEKPFISIRVGLDWPSGFREDVRK